MKLSFIRLIYGIFFQPQIFSKLRDAKILPAVFLVTIFTGICSMAVIGIHYPETSRIKDSINTWIDDNIVAVSITEKAVAFKTTKQQPFTTSLGEHTIVFDPNKDSFPEKRFLKENRTIWWITPESIDYFYNSAKHNKKQQLKLLNEGKIQLPPHPIMQVFFSPSEKNEYFLKDFLAKLETKRYDISAAELKQFFSSTSNFYLISCLYLFDKLIQVFFYVIIFTLLQKVVRSPFFRDMKMSNIFAIYLYCSIPAILLAIVYTSLPNVQMQFSTVFIIGLFLYVLLAAAKHLLATPIEAEEK